MGSHRVGHDWSNLAAVAAATLFTDHWEGTDRWKSWRWWRKEDTKHCFQKALEETRKHAASSTVGGWILGRSVAHPSSWDGRREAATGVLRVPGSPALLLAQRSLTRSVDPRCLPQPGAELVLWVEPTVLNQPLWAQRWACLSECASSFSPVKWSWMTSEGGREHGRKLWMCSGSRSSARPRDTPHDRSRYSQALDACWRPRGLPGLLQASCSDWPPLSTPLLSPLNSCFQFLVHLKNQR